MLKPSRSDLLPGSAVCSERRGKLIILGGCGEICDRVQRSPVESVGESLVLDWLWLYRGRSGEVGSLEVGGREVCDSRANGGGEISDRFLDLGRVVVSFGLVNPCDPIERRIGPVIRKSQGDEDLLEEVDMGRTKGVDPSLELFVLCKDERRLVYELPT